MNLYVFWQATKNQNSSISISERNLAPFPIAACMTCKIESHSYVTHFLSSLSAKLNANPLNNNCESVHNLITTKARTTMGLMEIHLIYIAGYGKLRMYELKP